MVRRFMEVPSNAKKTAYLCDRATSSQFPRRCSSVYLRSDVHVFPVGDEDQLALLEVNREREGRDKRLGKFVGKSLRVVSQKRQNMQTICYVGW